MSVLSQFYPQSAGGSSGLTLKMLLVAGGGGGGSGSGPFTPPSGQTTQQFSGSGGAGGIEYVEGYSVTPGTVLTVTIGGGGAGATYIPPAPQSPGTNGGLTSVKDPVGDTFYVYGGGAGAGPAPVGFNGGSGGGGSFTYKQPPGGYSSTGGGGLGYYNVDGATTTGVTFSSPQPGIVPAGTVRSLYPYMTQLQTKYGFKIGYPGIASVFNPAPTIFGGSSAAGTAGDFGFMSILSGSLVVYGRGGGGLGSGSGGSNTGNGGGAGSGAPAPAGGSGVVVIQYPDAYSTAPSFPGATDLSPSTPGFRTYQFTGTGSLTLP